MSIAWIGLAIAFFVGTGTERLAGGKHIAEHIDDVSIELSNFSNHYKLSKSRTIVSPGLGKVTARAQIDKSSASIEHIHRKASKYGWKKDSNYSGKCKNGNFLSISESENWISLKVVFGTACGSENWEKDSPMYILGNVILLVGFWLVPFARVRVLQKLNAEFSPQDFLVVIVTVLAVLQTAGTASLIYAAL